MTPEPEHVPGVTDDPVLRLILEGRTATLHEAEELYLDSSLDDISRLVASQSAPIVDTQLHIATRDVVRMLADRN